MKTYFLWLAVLLITATGCDSIALNLGQKDWFPSYEEQAYGRAIYSFARPDKPKVDPYQRVNETDTNPEVQPAAAPRKVGQGVPAPPVEGLIPIGNVVKADVPKDPGVPFWVEMDSADWCTHCIAWLKAAPEKLPGYRIAYFAADGSVDPTSHIRVRKHGNDFKSSLPRFIFFYRRPVDGAVIPIGNTVTGALSPDVFKTVWKLRTMEAERFDRTGWPTMETHAAGSDIWDSIADHVTVALSPNMKVRAAPGAFPTSPASFFNEMARLLAGGTIQLSDGVSAKTGTSLTLNVRREGDAIVASFQGQKPQVTVTKFLKLTTTLDGFTVTSTGARVHLGNVPQFLEPTFDFPK